MPLLLADNAQRYGFGAPLPPLPLARRYAS